MENKLTLEHLAPYLPYRLKVMLTENSKIAEMFVLNTVKFRGQIQIETIYGTYGDMYFKPILRPLSDLTKEIEHNGERFVPFDCLSSYSFSLNKEKKWSKVVLEDMPYSEASKLLEWHFDVFGLIEKGLAVDINTLKGGQNERNNENSI